MGEGKPELRPSPLQYLGLPAWAVLLIETLVDPVRREKAREAVVAGATQLWREIQRRGQLVDKIVFGNAPIRIDMSTFLGTSPSTELKATAEKLREQYVGYLRVSCRSERLREDEKHG